METWAAAQGVNNMTDHTKPEMDIADAFDEACLLTRQLDALHIGIEHILTKLTSGQASEPKEVSRAHEQAQMLSSLMGQTLAEIRTIQKGGLTNA